MSKILHGDCIEQLKTLEDNSVDSIVTDPPYELGFMGKKWDSTGIAYNTEVWKECLRVLKPGGHLLAFGGTRTYHRMTCAIEDSGFEIRDQIQWIYGSGFPKSMNISKTIDKKFGNLGVQSQGFSAAGNDGRKAELKQNLQFRSDYGYKYEPTDDLAKQWDGWGTALKPANEPIVLARKPLSEKSVVDNVLRWGTGGLNIDESRVEYLSEEDLKQQYNNFKGHGTQNHSAKSTFTSIENHDSNLVNTQGRFPANVILDEEAGDLLDEQSGTLKSGKNAIRSKEGFFCEHGGLGKVGDVQITYGDSGGASRFFYCAKASGKEKGKFNTHPTVKPIKLMEYLVNLVTPKDGIVLDPFSGSGSTLIAAKNKSFDYIGIEKEEEYINIIEKRLSVN